MIQDAIEKRILGMNKTSSSGLDCRGEKYGGLKPVRGLFKK